MTKHSRRKFSAEFKAKVAIEAVKNEKTLAELGHQSKNGNDQIRTLNSFCRKQCDILSVPRSSLYYQPIPEKPENVKMMRIMDKHLLKHLTEGVISMVDLIRDKGYPVGPKRIWRLFKLMGHQTLYR